MWLVSQLPVGTDVHWRLQTRTLPSRDAHKCTMKNTVIKSKMCSNPKNVRPTGHQLRRTNHTKHNECIVSNKWITWFLSKCYDRPELGKDIKELI